MKRLLTYFVITLQALFLVGMSLSYYLIDQVGKTIKLETLPVDPQDIFYGDYVTLRYEIEQIDESKWQGDKEPENGDTVYVLVEETDDGTYQVVQGSTDRLEVGAKEVMLKGRYLYRDSYDRVMHVDYGLGRYYIEDGSGKNYEQSGKMIVTVAIAPWGQKKIVSLD
ncbi:GDYXXLXY domain-containing protein [Aquibacillus salsiterrae]|uniref:GDYXXLXY domain-containing protein n=1 Tax=Aquibacillus salsiterrae TaxID=2950439 RepID=A0A9X4AGF7_9BACI|nr:GDYXXLXY domain-containing protein [Aquibacillus salsiterrae]MDC3417235.1 GDYXXLXY domain-containing protein [Aquibacillus salsiterrae]